MNLLKHAIWAIAVMTSIGVIAMETSKYNIEEEKQRAFMLKACVDAGGQWMKNLGPTWDCRRPATPPQS